MQRVGHTGARTQDHSVISTALYRLSYTTSSGPYPAKNYTHRPTHNSTSPSHSSSHLHVNAQQSTHYIRHLDATVDPFTPICFSVSVPPAFNEGHAELFDDCRASPLRSSGLPRASPRSLSFPVRKKEIVG